MASAVSREDRCRHGGNLQNQKYIYDDQHDQEGEILDEVERIAEIDRIHVVGHEEMAQHAHCRRCDNLVKGEAQIGLEPTPEEKLKLVENEKWNEDGAQ